MVKGAQFMRNVPIKKNNESLFASANYFVMTILAICTLFPFYLTVVNSVSPSEDFIYKDIILFPSRFEFRNYLFLLGSNSGLIMAYKVTLFVTIVGTFLNMAATALAAFPLAQRNLPYRSQITLFMVFTMYFGGGMIPTYLLVRNLHLLNSLWSLIVPGLVGTGILLFFRNFLMTIPAELTESAIIDGCSEFSAMVRIVLPLSMPAIATFTLFYAVGHWNDYYSGAIYISDYKKQPLQVFLRQVLYDVTVSGNQNDMAKAMQPGQTYKPPSETLKAAATIATTLPIMMFYPFLQKYFVKGLIMGSLKG